MNTMQRREMFALWRELGLASVRHRHHRLAVTARALRRPSVSTTSELSEADADTLLAWLRRRVAEPPVHLIFRDAHPAVGLRGTGAIGCDWDGVRNLRPPMRERTTDPLRATCPACVARYLDLEERMETDREATMADLRTVRSHRTATRTRPTVRIEDVRTLHAELTEAHAAGASSNDFAQIVDDWFTAHGFNTIIYR